jgi:RimJ/RimL family protein N-acetyltransferase
MKPVTFHTARLVLDRPTLNDVDLITEYCNDDAFSGQSMTTPWPYERKHAVGFVNELVPRWWDADAEYTWALRLDGVIIGVIGYRTAGRDIGYWMGAPYRRKGYMREAVNAVLDWIFAGGADEVVWETTVGNVSSVAVARSTGFTFTGTRDSLFTARDGTHPRAWQGVLAATDTREPKPDWPI